MSTLNNVDSVAHANQGSFKPSIAPDKPLTTKGHQPGRRINEVDQRPTFEAQVHPPGTAPASNSYTPNPISDPGSQANNPNVLRGHGKQSTYTAPGDTLTGATSRDLHRGMGKPLQGQTNVELHHDGAHGRKKDSAGLEAVGAYREDKGVERRFADQRGYEKEQNQSGLRSDKADRAGETMRPEPAETLDREWQYEKQPKRNTKGNVNDVYPK